MNNHAIVLLTVLELAFTQNLRGSLSTSVNDERVGGTSIESQIIGFIFGPLLFLLSFVVIWNNERKASIDFRRLSIMRNLLSKNNEIIIEDKQNLINTSLIYTSGLTAIQERVRDDSFNIELEDVLLLRRIVEVKQYRSYDGKEGNQELFWVRNNEEQVFKKSNKAENWFIKSQNFTSSKVKVGPYTLNQQQKLNIACEQKLQLKGAFIEKIAKSTGKKIILEDNYIYFPKQNSIQDHGSLRVHFQYCQKKTVSIVSGCNENNLLSPFRIDIYHNKGKQDSVGCCKTCSCCFICNCAAQIMKPIQEINLFSQKQQTFEEMIEHQLDINTCAVMTLRVIALSMLLAGIYFIFWPITDIIGYIPIVGGWIKQNVTSYIFLGSMVLGIPLYLLIFSVAWVRFNPKRGIPVLLLALVLIITIIVICSIY